MIRIGPGRQIVVADRRCWKHRFGQFGIEVRPRSAGVDDDRCMIFAVGRFNAANAARIDKNICYRRIRSVFDAALFSDFDVGPRQFSRLQVAVGRTITGIDQVVGSHVRHTRGDFPDWHVVDFEPDRMAHLDKRGNFGRTFGSFGDPQRPRLNEDLDISEPFEFFDDCHALNEHSRMLGVSAQLPKQAGGPAGRAVAKPLSFQHNHAGAAASELHRCTQSGDAATDDNNVRRVRFWHD